MSTLAIIALVLWQAAAVNPTDGPFTRDDLQRLAVLEGRWSGIEPNGDILFEAYDFSDDDTLRRRVYPDGSFTSPVNESVIRLENGEITLHSQAETVRVENGSVRYGSEDRSWRVVRLTDEEVEFEPVSAPYRMVWSLDDRSRIDMVRTTEPENGEPASYTYSLVRRW